MAKPKSEPTAIQKAAEAARERHKKAAEADKGKSTPATIAALKTAKDALTTAIAAEQEERFVKVATQRTKTARAAIKAIGKCFDKGYRFDKTKADKVVSGVSDAVAELARIKDNALSGNRTVASGDSFTL